MAVYVIAEAGVNHNGHLSLARELINAAAYAGADAVKFQTFRAADLVIATAIKAEYQLATTAHDEGQLQMIRRLELSPAAHETLMAEAKSCGIDFLSSPFDVKSAQLLADLGLHTIKVASGEITNAPLLIEIARSGARVILSTGMSEIGDVESALGALAWGFTASEAAHPGRTEFANAFASEKGKDALRSNVTLLHCTSEYPAPIGEVNLRAMETLRSTFNLPVGYSDHTKGFHIALAAVALGATVVEKHLTTDRTLPGPDHKTSIEPDEFREMVRMIRDVEAAEGDGTKKASRSESKNISIVRKTLVAAVPIRRGEAFSAANVTTKRTGLPGASPFSYWERLGTNATRDYAIDEPLDV